jgi:GH25 family lysozyme M1 (1,4-beta-N-acetylmuramidase)
MYSNHNDHSQTMANSGCGPTAMADVVATLKDKNINPYDLAELSMQWGDRSYNSGTDWSFFPHIAEHFKFTKMVQTKNLDALKACLDAGGYVVCSMGKGYWTSGGHYICAWKYTDTDIWCNDPASSKRTHQNVKDFVAQRKQFFCFYSDGEVGKNVDSGSNGDLSSDGASGGQSLKRGEKIVDISKYQPTVNYDELIADTALIILRAGYRGTAGGIHEDEKFAAHGLCLTERGVRFGVYFYSIAKTAEQAREEARMFYSYAKDYNPLFWAMDAEKDVITTGAIVAFIDELRKLGAKKVGCYVANHLYNKYDYASIRDQMDFTWIPRYGSTKPVHKCDLWQYTSTGSVDGISSNVDLDKITGEGHDLKWFTEG